MSLDLGAREAQLLALNEELDRRKAELADRAESTILEQQRRLRQLEDDDESASAHFDSPPRDSDGRSEYDHLDPGARRGSGASREQSILLDEGSQLQSVAGGGTDTAASSPFAAPVRRKAAPAGAADKRGANSSPAIASGSAARSAAADESTSAARAEPEPDLSEATGLGPEAAVRYYRARLQVQGDELERLRALLTRTAAESREWEARATEAVAARAKLERAARDAAARAEKEQRQAAELRAQVEALEAALSGTRRDADGVSRDAKQRQGDAKAKELRLNRALEELERTRLALAQAQADARNAAGPVAQAERAALGAENGRLRKQKGELLLAFKKMARLVDVLKRQKLHIEAARALQFTEEEFSKALQLGELSQ